jgi:hypothetical protein
MARQLQALAPSPTGEDPNLGEAMGSVKAHGSNAPSLAAWSCINSPVAHRVATMG